MRIGTSHFISKEKAIKYFAEYHYNNTVQAVNDKLERGEIHIGTPKIKENESLELNNEGRYI